MSLVVKALVAFTIFSLLPSHAEAGSAAEQIDRLIESVRLSGCDFERNGKRHSSVEAADHLQRKLRSATTSWFAPSKENWTVDMFIDKLATRSSMTGEPYFMHCQGRVKEAAADWLRRAAAPREPRSTPSPLPKGN